MLQYSTPYQPVSTAWPPDTGSKPDSSPPGTRVCQSANFSYIMTLPSSSSGTCGSYTVSIYSLYTCVCLRLDSCCGVATLQQHGRLQVQISSPNGSLSVLILW